MKERCCKNCSNYVERKPPIKIPKKKCILCEKKIDWEHHLPPLPYVMFDNTLIDRYCPDCWNRIWAEWYEYPYDTEYYELTYTSPSAEYIIGKYKGNDLVAKIEREMIVEEPKLPKTSPLKTLWGKKKHWWNK